MATTKAAVDRAEERRDARTRLDPALWTAPLVVTAATLAAIVTVYFDSFRSIVSIWARSDTFAHGYLILPISLYLVWDARERLVGLVPRPDSVALASLALVGFGWLACRLAGVLVLEQYLVVATIPIAVWAVLGREVARRLLFPMGFLLLGVPVGEALIPPLIDFTAAFTVLGLQLSGIPVLREGDFLTLSNSHWAVVEACSGLRYLIASVTLGILYAYLTYRSWWRRALCVVAAAIVPIFANGVRAYMIVMLGHLSDMRIAVGVDHLIYGWIFFGIVILLFFWVGSFFREDEPHDSGNSPDEPPGGRPSRSRLVLAGVAAVLVAATWPAWASQSASSVASDVAGHPSIFPRGAGAWAAVAVDVGWEPHYVGADFTALQWYERDGEHAGAHAACYVRQTQGAELVSSANGLIAPREPRWRLFETSERVVSLPSGEWSVVESVLDARGPKMVAWSWYWLDGTAMLSPYRAKLVELTGKLLGSPPLACGVTVFVAGEDDAAARATLTDFLGDALPAIEAGLSSVSRDE